MKGHPKPRGQGGFTLVEQVIVAAVLVVLACVAAPALGHLVVRNRLQIAQSDIIAALQQTRGMALQSGRRAMLCPTLDGKQCTDGVHWEAGWLAGRYRSDSADQLDAAPAFADRGHERLVIISTAGRKRIRFQADGTASGSNTTFTVCRAGEPDGALVVLLSNAGRIYGKKASEEQANRCATDG